MRRRGYCWLAVTGTPAQVELAEALFESVREEPPFML